MKKYFVALILLLSFNNLVCIQPPAVLQKGYSIEEGQKCNSKVLMLNIIYDITDPYTSACWYGWNSNSGLNRRNLALMPAGSTCEKTNPNCILNPENRNPSLLDPQSYSTLCKPYIDDVKKYKNDPEKKQFAINLAKACLIGYDTNATKADWCYHNLSNGLHNQ